MFPTLIHIGPIYISSFSTFFFIGLIVGIYSTWKQAKTRLYPENDFFDALFVSVLFAFAGARMMYVFLHFDEFGWSMLSWAAVWLNSGYSLVGGLLGGLLGLFVVCRTKKEFTFWEAADLFAFSFWIAALIGLFGSFLAGFDQGRPSGISDIEHPVGLYRFVGLLILLMPYLVYRFEKEHETSIHIRSGLFTMLFGASFSFVWILVDFVRKGTYYVTILTVDQLIMLVLFILSVVGLVVYHRDWFAHVINRLTKTRTKKQLSNI